MMDDIKSETTLRQQWREHMIVDVLPSLNQIGHNLAGAFLKPKDPEQPTTQEIAVTKAAGDLLDLGERFLASCLTLRNGDSQEVPPWLEEMTEQQLMDALALKSGTKIINATVCDPATSHHRDTGSGGNCSR